jgi:peptide/nickel transport system permease protein
MLIWLLRRVLAAVPVFIGITGLVFVLLRLTPGDPVLLLISPDMIAGAPPGFIESRRSELGLDQPIPVQYLIWARELFGGNLGYSYSDSRPVVDVVAERVGPTLLLMGSALLIAVTVGVLLGIFAAVRRGSAWDHATTVGSLAVVSTPSFFLGLAGIYIFALRLDVVPIGGMSTVGQPATPLDTLHHLILPAAILGLSFAAPIVRYTRGSVIEVLHQDFLVTARSKGLSRRSVTWRHALPNALIPVISVVGVMLPLVLGGAVVIEKIFAWPGMGQLMLQALGQRNYPVLMGITLLFAIVVLVSSILTDLLYGLVDPRIRLK